jgi:hypothetical protein
VGAADDQTGDVRDVRDQERIDLARDLRERREIDGTGDRRTAAEDHFRALGEGDLADPIHVDTTGGLVDTVVDRMEPLAGGRHRRSVGEVATMGELQRQERVTGRRKGEVHGEVGR